METTMRALALVSMLLLAGCDDHLFPRVGGDDYTSDWSGTQRLMADHCHECHPALSVPDMPSEIEADVVNTTGTWVVPGDPMASELYLVMIDASAIGTDAMPLGSDLLPAQNTDAVRDWIANGAAIE